jgi:hypothetical protein
LPEAWLPPLALLNEVVELEVEDIVKVDLKSSAEATMTNAKSKKEGKKNQES